MTRPAHQVTDRPGQPDLRDLLAAPPADARPGIRWWWAAPLAAPEALRELRAVADAGFGEVEVAFSPHAWATPGQRVVLRAVLDEATELGLTVSITMGASWPVNTPNTGEGSGHSARELQHGRVDLRDGSAWVGPAPAPFDADVHDQPRRLVAVSAARVLRDGDRAELLPADQRPRWGTPVRALTSSTVLDPDSLVLLEGATAEHVTFTPPDRDHWVLVASWEREARGHHTDPFAAGAARAATAYLDEHQLGPEALAAVQASAGDFFEDSLELDATSVFWTPELPARFAERRCYDLLRVLPLVYAHGMSNYWVPDREPVPDHDLPDGLGEAVRQDFLRTLTDLYVEDHLAAYQEWAESHGRTFKAQVAYGQDLEPVRSARALALLGGRVETESLNSGDRAPVRQDHPTWRFALDHQRSLVSGVHQTGCTRVSTELGAQFLATYELSLGDYREMMDKEWAVGVTRPYVHGLAHDPAGTPWPGRQRFGDYTAESWNPAHFPQWASWPVLTDYWARGTALLESGTARADVAFLRDGFLTSAARGFADPDLEGLSPSRLVDARPLEQEGYVVQLVDPVLLEEADPATAGELLPETAAYRTVVVDQRSISPRVLERLLVSAQGGLRIVLVGDLPTRSATLDPAAAGSVPDLVAELLTQATVTAVELACEVAAALRGL
ncbi:MAG: Uncharacterized protein JWR42_2006, partial [Marmoricola sp.]|nr:Uncharacterized protein [Marmoricola sp.]